MPMMTRLFIPIGLTIANIAIGAPCYTDIKDGCGDDSAAIFVKTKNTNKGLCTEYINEQKQKVMRCYKNTDVQNERVITRNSRNNIQNNESGTKYITYNNQSQQVYNYTDSSSSSGNNYDSSYWDGYWNGYSYYPNSPRHHNRPPPPPRPTVVTVPSRYAGSPHNSSKLSSVTPSHERPSPPQSNNRPPRDDRYDQPPTVKPAVKSRSRRK